MKNETMSRNGKTRNGRSVLHRVAFTLRRTAREMDRAAMAPQWRDRLTRAAEDIDKVRDSIAKGSARRDGIETAEQFLDEMERRRRACDEEMLDRINRNEERVFWCRKYADEMQAGASSDHAAEVADQYIARLAEAEGRFEARREGRA